MYATTSAAMLAAIARQQAAQCATGRHPVGCPHHPVAPWVRAALAKSLPAKELAR